MGYTQSMGPQSVRHDWATNTSWCHLVCSFVPRLPVNWQSVRSGGLLGSRFGLFWCCVLPTGGINIQLLFGHVAALS